MKLLDVIRSRDEEAAKPRDDRGRALSPREQMMRTITTRRGAHR